MVYIEKLGKERKSKDQIIKHLLVSLKNLTRCSKRNAVLDNTAIQQVYWKPFPKLIKQVTCLEKEKVVILEFYQY